MFLCHTVQNRQTVGALRQRLNVEKLGNYYHDQSDTFKKSIVTLPVFPDIRRIIFFHIKYILTGFVV
jgi:hypothetical protein